MQGEAIAAPGKEAAVPSHPRHHLRIVTAASLFDGHDAAINIMRRILQASGCEVIHLGHDRSAEEVVDTSIQEDVQAVAVTSYQGGHIEYFKYIHDLLQEHGAGHIRIFGGGGGVILPEEIRELTDYGIARIYSPDDGRVLGLQGMINDMIERSDFPLGDDLPDKVLDELSSGRNVPRLISAAENFRDRHAQLFAAIAERAAGSKTPVLGITGTGGAGKSTIVDELVRRFLRDFADKRIAIISVDPSRKKSGGALLGDRIRMNAIHHPHVYMRSMATRQSHLALSPAVMDAVHILKAAAFDLIVLETSGIGQSDTEIMDHSDASLYVMTPDYGAAMQLEKIDMLDFADVVAVNKFDKGGATDALRDVRKQYQRNHQQWNRSPDDMPVVGTIASQFNDPGTEHLYQTVMACLAEETGSLKPVPNMEANGVSEKIHIVPPARTQYLTEIATNNREYDKHAIEQAACAQKLYAVELTIEQLKGKEVPGDLKVLQVECAALREQLDPENIRLLASWGGLVEKYTAPAYHFRVRDTELTVKTHTESLSHTNIPKVALPRYEAWGDRLRWLLQENVPGTFPYTAGIYPFKRETEDPTRMFAGEGGPERTNHRFHYLSRDMPARRLSTAFDSVTLYGRDPDYRPDIYGKIGNAGVSICCLDDAKRLYSGFDLADPRTSVSMTINGPSPFILAYFLNTAIDQQCEHHIREIGKIKEVEEMVDAKYQSLSVNRPAYHGELPAGHDGLGLLLLGTTGDTVLPPETYARIKADTLSRVRGTVQADILKEDQAQNTCIFSTEFALKLMGDVQEYFIQHRIRNFYSVSVSGYHIAEAGANPITQLAFTLANGFTYVEYYLSRGMSIDDFAPNLSFFFSNGIDAEYAVIGRVARRIWAKALKFKYRANPRSQMLKYHIQTSGRSLHAQEVSFNDIRTTLQALYAIYDNCNSLHTNAYDEAITTPTEESVRRAVAIQLIINRELGLAKNENPLQGSFVIEELTDLVEEAVLSEFERISQRGGVLGAMESMYQRGKIQDESLYYETLKHSGELQIIGVNTFTDVLGSPTIRPHEVTRATRQEKEAQIDTARTLQSAQPQHAGEQLRQLQEAAIRNENIFEAIMEAAKHCSLGQLTTALFQVGGQYRRNM